MASRTRDGSGISTKHAENRSMSEAGRCSTIEKQKRKTFWNAWRCWQRGHVSAAFIGLKVLKKTPFCHFYGKRHATPSKSRRFCSMTIISVEPRLTGHGPMLDVNRKKERVDADEPGEYWRVAPSLSRKTACGWVAVSDRRRPRQR